MATTVVACKRCEGSGKYWESSGYRGDDGELVVCDHCEGSGRLVRIEASVEIPYVDSDTFHEVRKLDLPYKLSKEVVEKFGSSKTKRAIGL